ncbi:MAG TPA: LCP family protein [Pseudobacteroides sp.]|uniref:LCP family glycopolymer transferase n=1 Tax=Pseudobacteroides sp. TaxID=1968840 RepID=UPI002F95A931
MKCNNFDDIVLYVDRALSDEAAKALEDHIKVCGECQKMTDTLIYTRDFLKNEAIANKSIDDKVLKSIDQSRYANPKNRFILSHGLIVFRQILKPAAAILLICVALLWLGYGRYFKDNKETLTSEPTIASSEPVNILILGNDSYKNTDAIALINFDPISTKLNVLSLPRDTGININGSRSKLGLAYHQGGPGTAAKAVSDLLNIDIKYYVCFDTAAAQKLIDLLDGVDFSSPVDLYYDDPVQNLHINIQKGQNHLSGKQAVELMKFRMPSRKNENDNLLKFYDGSDLKRIEAQQNMLKALIEQKLNMKYVSKINELLEIMLSATQSNIPLSDAINMIRNIHKLNSNDVNMFILPGLPRQLDGSFYYNMDNEASQSILKGYFQYNTN